MEKVKLDDGRITLIRGDCLEIMPKMKAGIINSVVSDWPYGTTQNRWDTVLPFDTMWKELARLCVSNVSVVLTASQPFTSLLITSNLEWFRHEWIWRKNNGSNFANVKREPFKEHESVLLFSPGKWVYNPIMQERFSEESKQRNKYKLPAQHKKSTNYGEFNPVDSKQYGELRYPSSVQDFNIVPNAKGRSHPNEKPIALMEYLIKTYTNEGDLVMDNTMGSGTTAVACINTNRRFVGMEKEENYFKTCIERCENAITERDNKLAA